MERSIAPRLIVDPGPSPGIDPCPAPRTAPIPPRRGNQTLPLPIADASHRCHPNPRIRPCPGHIPADAIARSANSDRRTSRSKSSGPPRWKTLAGPTSSTTGAISRYYRYEHSSSARYVSNDVVGYEDLDDNGDWRPRWAMAMSGSPRRCWMGTVPRWPLGVDRSLGIDLGRRCTLGLCSVPLWPLGVLVGPLGMDSWTDGSEAGLRTALVVFVGGGGIGIGGNVGWFHSAHAKCTFRHIA